MMYTRVQFADTWAQLVAWRQLVRHQPIHGAMLRAKDNRLELEL